ncbi:MAG: hypothetical protein WC852_06115 [Candidatus Nanoarchaeia archaeon]
MRYDRVLGKALAVRHLSEIRFEKKLLHSFNVGEFAYKVASRILQNHTSLTHLDAELAGFLGYVHDIGVSRTPLCHEIPSIEILIEDGVEPSIAKMAMHGQMEEQYGNGDGRYLPVGIEGMILTYSDMTVHIENPMSIEDRIVDIKQRVSNVKKIPDDKKKEIIENIDKAYPRYKAYERIIFLIADVNSFKDF